MTRWSTSERRRASFANSLRSASIRFTGLSVTRTIPFITRPPHQDGRRGQRGCCRDSCAGAQRRAWARRPAFAVQPSRRMLDVGRVFAVLHGRVAHRAGEQLGFGGFAVLDYPAISALGRTTRNMARKDSVELSEAVVLVLGSRWRGQLQRQLRRLLDLVGRHIGQRPAIKRRRSSGVSLATSRSACSNSDTGSWVAGSGNCPAYRLYAGNVGVPCGS